MINCAIIDDEQHSIDLIKEYIAITPGLVLSYSETSPVTALEFINSNKKVDLIFLDVEMPELSGFEFIEKCTTNTKFILITAYDKYAVESYNFNIVDYLLKPVIYERFTQGIKKYILQNNNKSLKSFFVNSEKRLVKIDVDQVLFVESFGNIINIHLINKKIIKTYLSLSEIEKYMHEPEFFKVNRSTLIAFRFIKSLNLTSVNIIDGEMEKVFSISENYRKTLFNYIHKID